MARKKATTQKENCQNQFKQSMQHKTTAGHLKFPQMRGGKNKKINVQIHIIYTIVNKNNQKEIKKKNDHKLKQDYHQKVWNNCKDVRHTQCLQRETKRPQRLKLTTKTSEAASEFMQKPCFSATNGTFLQEPVRGLNVSFLTPFRLF